MTRTAEQILADRREADKRRFKRYKERQEALGKRHISGMISAEAYNLLCRERDQTGDSTATIIERALVGFYEEPERISEPETIQPASLVDTEPVSDKLEPQPDQEPEPVEYDVEPQQEAVPDLKPEPEEKAEVKESVSFDREAMKERIYNLKTEQGMGWTAIAKIFNEEGIPAPSGKPGKWSDMAVKRLFKEKEKELTS